MDFKKIKLFFNIFPSSYRYRKSVMNKEHSVYTGAALKSAKIARAFDPFFPADYLYSIDTMIYITKQLP